MKILIAEDEKELQKSMVTYLERDGNICETASDYKEAMYKTDMYEYDILILDINLITGSVPGINLKCNQYPRNHQYNLPNSIPHIFYRLVIISQFFVEYF